MSQIFNRSDLMKTRKRLRSEMPPAERILWSRLKKKQLGGFKFRRQYSVGPYVLDFYCPSVKLAVEIDGDLHYQDRAQEYDQQRDRYIENFGLRICRYTNQEIYRNLDDVLEDILANLNRGLPTDR